MELATLVLVALLAVGAVLFLLRPQPKPQPPEESKPPTPEPVRLLGVAITPVYTPTWFDPGKWGPYHFSLGVPLTFKAAVHDPDPGDYIYPVRSTWYLVRDGFPGFVVPPASVAGVEWTWNGEGVGTSCGQRSPIPMTIHTVVTLSDGTVLQDKRQFFLVPELACRGGGCG